MKCFPSFFTFGAFTPKKPAAVVQNGGRVPVKGVLEILPYLMVAAKAGLENDCLCPGPLLNKMDLVSIHLDELRLAGLFRIQVNLDNLLTNRSGCEQ